MQIHQVPKLVQKHWLSLLLTPTGILIGLLILFGIQLMFSKQQAATLQKNLHTSEQKVATSEKALNTLKSQDQFKRNESLQKEIKDIQSTYKTTVGTYETIIDLKAQKQDTTSYEKQLAQSIKYLSDRNYGSGAATLTTLNGQITADQQKIAAAAAAQVVQNTNVPTSNSAPGTGFSQQKVHTDSGDFIVSIIAGDLGSTKVIVDTASDSDCHDNCPVLSLADYVSRNGAFAGINGSYFCPASYPSCAGKTNSYDLLVMNKNKHYFNSDNNTYSTNPAVIFQGGSVRFVGQTLEWGRDTGIDSMLSNYPLLVSGGNSVYSDNPDPKFNSRGPRCFVANKGNTVYIGIVSNATMGDSAKVLKTMGMENALNLDEGGSTALWYGGYKAGPGRNIPNAVLFVRK